VEPIKRRNSECIAHREGNSIRKHRAAAQPALAVDAATQPRDRAYLETDFGSTVVPIKRCGATEAQGVGPSINAIPVDTELSCPDTYATLIIPR
jgi:hypothetical protein